MEINGTKAVHTNKYVRLSTNDITRMPSLNVNRIDFYQGTNPQSMQNSSNYWGKIFTAATFGIVGLYIAHRNNLFNPVRRETKKILNDKNLQDRVLDFVKEKLKPELYIDTTKRFLENLKNNSSRPKDFIQETEKILNNKASFQELMEKITKRLNDDTPEGLQEGFCVDILDRLFTKIERFLTKNKQNGLPYKNQNANVIDKIFAKSQNANSIAEETLYEAIANRSSSTIETYINDSIIKTKLPAS